MTVRLFLKRYWRIPLVALLAAITAFGASFAQSASYTSTTRMLIQARSTTLLDSSGKPISDQPAVNDVNLAQTLSQTQSGLASSREVATMVVDQLHLDAPKPAHAGPIHWLEGAAASTYVHVKAWITAGFYKRPGRREKAIQTTQSAINANDLAPSGGPNTGQANSYILELSAKGETPVQARQIANAASDSLIIVSQQFFTQNSKSFTTALSSQLSDAKATLAKDNQAVSAYEMANNVSSLDQQLVQSVQNQGTLESQLVAAQASVEGDKQTVASLQSTLGTIAATTTSSQNVTTGRSSTDVNTTQANPVYQTIQGQISLAKASLASDTARATALQSKDQSNPSSALTQAQAGLLSLEEQVTADQHSLQSLSSSLQQAGTNAQVSPVGLSRLGDASLPTYPTSPKRYLYLLLGLLIGGLGGSGLTYLARRRLLPADADGETEAPILEPPVSQNGDVDRGGDLMPARRPIPVGSYAGAVGGNGQRGSNGNSRPT